MNPVIFRTPPSRFYDFTKMSDADIARELKRIQADGNKLAARVGEIEEHLVIEAYRGMR